MRKILKAAHRMQSTYQTKVRILSQLFANTETHTLFDLAVNFKCNLL